MNLLSAALALVFVVETSASALAQAPAPTAAPAPASAQAAPSLASTLARIDELHKRRDDRAAWAEEQRLAQAALASAPQDYGALWRAARVSFWMSDDPSLDNDQRSKLGKEGWDLAERAIAANGGDVAGYYYAALCMGNYSLGLGIVKALAKGLEGKFRDRLGHAEKLNARYERGGIDTAWGRFYEKLPWPKRDRAKSAEHLRRAIQIEPAQLRARVYLAETLLEDDHAAEAKRLLDEVSAAPLGRYDAAEERRAKALGAALMPKVLKELK